MVKNTRKKEGIGIIQTLNNPRPVEIETDEANNLATVTLGQRKVNIARVTDVWSIEDEWWREEPISRVYYIIVLENCSSITVFFDRIHCKWYKQHT